MPDFLLPEKFTKVTRSTVVVPAPDDVGGLFEPTSGRTVIPEHVEMTVRWYYGAWTYGVDRGDYAYAYVAVTGTRLLKSGDAGGRIITTGWEDEVVEGRHGVTYRPQWLTDLLAAHLPAVLDLAVSQ